MQSFHFKGTRKSWAISCLKMESTKCFQINSSLLPGKLRMKTWVKVGLTCSIEIIYGVLIPECDKARKVSPGMCRKVCLIHADSSSRSDNQSSGEPGSGGRCWLSVPGAGLTLRLLDTDSKLDHSNQHMLPETRDLVCTRATSAVCAEIQSQLGLLQCQRSFTQVNQALLYLCEIDHNEQMISST